MSISSVITRITRRLHQVAVEAHVASLRLTVQVATAKARVLNAEADIAASAAVVAQRLAVSAQVQAGAAFKAASVVKLGAQIEATSIGSAL